MSKLKTIGIVGTGHMGSAIARGILAKKLFRGGQVWIYDVDLKKASGLAKELKVKCAKSPVELAEHSGLILLAVKPQNLPETASELKPYLGKNPNLVTILAGVSIRTVKKHFGGESRIVRAMPNLAATVGEAITAITGDRGLLPTARKIFECCGKVFVLPESYFHTVTALSGSGPAYYFLLMELVMKEAKKRGFTEKQSMLLAKQTAKGAALLADHSTLTPDVLRAQVTSKGGTTDAALGVLFSKKFPVVFAKAIEAAVRRGKELGKAVS